MKRFIVFLIMLLAPVLQADWLGTFDINEYLGLAITTHRFSSGAAYTSADVQYRIYEETAGAWHTTEVVAAANMDEDFDGVTGLHVEGIQLTAGNGFEINKSYLVVYTATVDSVVAIATDRFRIRVDPLATTSAVADVPTVAEFEARSIVAANYVVVGDTIAGVTLVATTTAVSNTLNVNVASEDNIDFGAAKKTSLDAATPDLSAITGDKNSYKATGFAVLGEPLTAQEVEDTVWDAPLTGASHNNATSAGRRLRQIEHANVLREEEQAQGGSASTITLHNDASSINNFYNDIQVVIVGDTGIGQSRHIHSYVGNTRVATVSPDWVTTPDNTSDYVIYSDSEKHIHSIDNDAITAAAIANAAIDAATFAADVDAEIAAYILNALTNAYGGAGTYGQAIEDTLADTNELQTDWKDGGRLDLIIDIIQAYWDSLTITSGLLEVIHGNI